MSFMTNLIARKMGLLILIVAASCSLLVTRPVLAAECMCKDVAGSRDAASCAACVDQCKGGGLGSMSGYNGRSGQGCSADGQAISLGAPVVPDVPVPPTPPTRTPGEFHYNNPLGSVSLNEIIGRVVRTALGFVGALFLAMFVYGGTTWMIAGGDSEKVKSSQKILLNSVIGLIVIGISYSIISIVFETASLIKQ